MPWPQPPPIVILAVLVAVALPTSAAFGLLAWKAFDLLFTPHDVTTGPDPDALPPT